MMHLEDSDPYHNEEKWRYSKFRSQIIKCKGGKTKGFSS
jgi:hypothetical protein